MKISDEEYLKAALTIFSEVKTTIHYPSTDFKGDTPKKTENTADEYAKYVAVIANRLKADLDDK